MSVSYGPPTPPRRDTYDEAELALIADVRRLGQVHQVEGWGLLGNGTRYLLCSCDHKVRADEVFWNHLIAALTKERGLVRPPKR